MNEVLTDVALKFRSLWTLWHPFGTVVTIYPLTRRHTRQDLSNV